jgi:FkbM family methyltransferase
MSRFASAVRSVVPDKAFYRLVAASYRARAEERMLFLDEFAPRGSDAIDIGAWWGPWTYWLARRCELVWAFEPNPRLAAFLEGVVADNVRLENVALSDHAGTGTLFASTDVGRDALATLSAAHGEPGAERTEVPLRRLDEFGIERAGFLKLDVEGHEFEVFKGAEQTLARCRPTILVEIDRAYHDEPIQRIFDWLAERGYEGRVRRGGEWAGLETFDVATDQSAGTDPRDAAYINDFVFTPRG